MRRQRQQQRRQSSGGNSVRREQQAPANNAEEDVALFEKGRDVAAYIEQHAPALRDLLGGGGGGGEAPWAVRELRGGVINTAWAVTGPRASILLKQAPPFVRAVGPSFPLSTERMRVEAAAMRWLNDELLPLPPASGAADTAADDERPALVPPLLHHDAARSVLATRLLPPPRHVTLLAALREGRVVPRLPARLSALLGRMFAATSAAALGREAHALKAAGEFANAEIVEANMRVVMGGAFDAGDPTNRWLPELDADARALWGDARAMAAVAAARALFDQRRRGRDRDCCLIHHDLHAANVLVANGDGDNDADADADAGDAAVVVIDWEFATFGPPAYDLGCAAASLAIAAAYAAALGRLPTAAAGTAAAAAAGDEAATAPPTAGPTRAEQHAWLLDAIGELLRRTLDVWRRERLRVRERLKAGGGGGGGSSDCGSGEEEAAEDFDARVLAEACAFAGCCAARYVTGMHDHELPAALPDHSARVACERAVLRIGRRLLVASSLPARLEAAAAGGEGSSRSGPSIDDIVNIIREECKQQG